MFLSIFNLICLIVHKLRSKDKQEPMTEAEVDDLLRDLSGKQAETMNWEHSIVDLMKLLGLDSSLKARKALALELGYPDDVNTGSAEMNVWLSKEVRKRIATHNVDSLREGN